MAMRNLEGANFTKLHTQLGAQGTLGPGAYGKRKTGPVLKVLTPSARTGRDLFAELGKKLELGLRNRSCYQGGT